MTQVIYEFIAGKAYTAVAVRFGGANDNFKKIALKEPMKIKIGGHYRFTVMPNEERAFATEIRSPEGKTRVKKIKGENAQ